MKQRYRRDPNSRPFWTEHNCAEDNRHMRIGTEDYLIDGNGLLMPQRPGQSVPDLRHFNQR